MNQAQVLLANTSPLSFPAPVTDHSVCADGITTESDRRDGRETFPTSGPYRQLAVQTERILQGASVRKSGLASSQCKLAPQFATKESLNGRFGLSMQAWDLCRDGNRVAQVRMVMIAGKTNEIINTWIFPYDANVAPVFASELIAMANAPRLTFMDVQIPGLRASYGEIVRAYTASVRTNFADLVIDEVPPSWAVDATQGNYLFTRAVSGVLFPRIQAAYLQLLSCYLQYLASTPMSWTSEAERSRAQQVLHAYQLHHLNHSPGGNFLSKVFGDQWTNEFLNSVLFTLPVKECHA